MPITPEDARRELLRRQAVAELQRRATTPPPGGSPPRTITVEGATPTEAEDANTALREKYPQMFQPGWAPGYKHPLREVARRAVRRVAAPMASGVTGGVAGITTRLPDVLDEVLAVVGVPEDKRITPLKLLNTELIANNAYWEKTIKEEGVSGVEKLLGKAIGGFAPGMLNWMGGVPLAAVEGGTEAAKEGKGPVGIVKGATKEAAKRFALGKLLEGIGLIKNPILRRGSSGATLAGSALLEGGTSGEALIQGAVGVAMGKPTKGKRVLHRKPVAETPLIYAQPETVSSVGAKAGPTFEPRRETVAPQKTISTPETTTDSSFLEAMWSTVRDYVPGKPLVPTPQTFRQALVNRHIALYQAFDRVHPGGPLQRQLGKDIYETIRAINMLDGVTDPLEGRPTVPPELERLRAKKPSVLEDISRAEKAVAERNAALEEVQIKAAEKRIQQEEADAWLATRKNPPVVPEGAPPVKRNIRKQETPPVTEIPTPVESVPTGIPIPGRPPIGVSSAGAGEQGPSIRWVYPSEPSATEPISEGGHSPISTRNVDTARVRMEENLPPRVRPKRQYIDVKQEMWATEAEKITPVEVDALAEEMNKTPYPLDKVQEQAFRREIDKTHREYLSLIEAADKLSAGSPALRANLAAQGQLRGRSESLIRATELGGTEESAAFSSRKNLKRVLENDADPLAVAARGAQAKGDKLTEPERMKLETSARDVKETADKVDKLESEGNRRMAEEVLRPKPRKRRLRRGKPMSRGVTRYERMTEAEKDAELQDLLQREKDPATIAHIAENIASRPEFGTFEDVINRVGVLLPDMGQNTIIDAIAESGRRQPHVVNEMTARIRGLLKGPAKTNKTLADDLKDILYYLESGEVRPKPERGLRTEADINHRLREARDLMREMQKSSLPEVQAKLESQIKFLDARIANEDYGPRPRRVRSTYPQELYRQRMELARRQAIVRAKVEQLQPKTLANRAAVEASEACKLLQSWDSSFDDSALLNQGGWQVVTHPIRSLRVQPGVLRAAISDAAALQYMDELVGQAPDAWRLARDKVKLYPVAGRDVFTGGAEQLRSDWLAAIAQRFPRMTLPLGFGQRAYALTLNVLRVGAYRAFARAYLADGGPTPAQGEGIAFHVNCTTGAVPLGGRGEQLVKNLNGIQWAPQYRISQLLNTVFYSGWRPDIPPEVRSQILLDHALHIINGLLIARTLSLLLGEPEQDPNSSHFRAWLIPGTHTYYKPFAQEARITSLIWQLASGERKNKAGHIVPIRGADIGFGQPTGVDLLKNYFRSGLAPVPAAAWDRFLTGTVYPTGEEATLLKVALKAVQPIMFQNLLDIMHDDMGLDTATGLNALNYFGASLQTELNEGKSAGPARRVIRKRLP